VVLLYQVEILRSILNVEDFALQSLVRMLDDFVDERTLLSHVSSIGNPEVVPLVNDASTCRP